MGWTGDVSAIQALGPYVTMRIFLTYKLGRRCGKLELMPFH